MPGEYNFDAALAELVGYIENTGREIVGEIEDETADGDPVSGFQCQQGSFRFIIHRSPDTPRFRAVSKYDMVMEIAQAQAAAEISDESDELPELTEERTNAAVDHLKELNERAGEKQIDELHFRLIDKLSCPHCTFSIDHLESGALQGFSVGKDIFVYEDSFSISDFDEAIQAIVGTAFPAQVLLDQAFGFRSLADEETESTTDELSSTGPSPRGFQ